ncbi:MAG: TetR family transcriptional regulator [Kutzneria sp.]|nr:TetR family transcriptional regulator [Kutzneria sp.]
MPPDPVAPKGSSATKARILEAAVAEFAERGVAGARVDRIAEAAKANKRLIYVYFGNKDRLFDIVVQHCVRTLAEAVPLTPYDLPAYAGALFDYLTAHPHLLRLATWKLLERPEIDVAEQESYRAKISMLTSAADTFSPGLHPVDVLAVVLGLARTWPTTSPALRGLAAEDPTSPQRLARHRAAVVAAVRGLQTGPVDPGTPVSGPPSRAGEDNPRTGPWPSGGTRIRAES